MSIMRDSLMTCSKLTPKVVPKTFTSPKIQIIDKIEQTPAESKQSDTDSEEFRTSFSDDVPQERPQEVDASASFYHNQTPVSTVHERALLQEA